MVGNNTFIQVSHTFVPGGGPPSNAPHIKMNDTNKENGININQDNINATLCTLRELFIYRIISKLYQKAE